MRRTQRGAALLEFAVALPFSLMLFVGISDFSVYFWRQSQMEETARLALIKISPALPQYAAADIDALHRYAHALQDQIRSESGSTTLTIALTRDYACPTATGEEQPSTEIPTHCKDERAYLRIAGDTPVAPMFTPLRAIGFPKTAFSRHVIRLR